MKAWTGAGVLSVAIPISFAVIVLGACGSEAGGAPPALTSGDAADLESADEGSNTTSSSSTSGGGVGSSTSSGGVATSSSSASSGGGGSSSGGDDGDPSDWTTTTCASATFYPGVPATPIALMASGPTAYAFLSSSHWTKITAGVGITEPIPAPAGGASVTVEHVEVEPNGKNLVVFKDGAVHFASFFSDGTFAPPTTLPSKTVLAHSDGQGRLVAVDSDRVLWTWDGAAFANRGALPVPLDASHSWAVAHDGTVHVAWVRSGSTALNVTKLASTSSTWTTAINLTPAYQVVVSAPRLVAARDGSLHMAFFITLQNGIFGSYDQLYYSRSSDGATWSDGERLRTAVTTNGGVTVSPRLVYFTARTYDSAQAVVFSDHLLLSRRCGPSDTTGWPATVILTSSNAWPMANVNEVGVPSIAAQGPASMEVRQRM